MHVCHGHCNSSFLSPCGSSDTTSLATVSEYCPGSANLSLFPQARQSAAAARSSWERRTVLLGRQYHNLDRSKGVISLCQHPRRGSDCLESLMEVHPGPISAPNHTPDPLQEGMQDLAVSTVPPSLCTCARKQPLPICSNFYCPCMSQNRCT